MSPSRAAAGSRDALRPTIALDDVMQLRGGLARLFAQHPSRLVPYAVTDGLPGFHHRRALAGAEERGVIAARLADAHKS